MPSDVPPSNHHDLLKSLVEVMRNTHAVLDLLCGKVENESSCRSPSLWRERFRTEVRGEGLARSNDDDEDAFLELTSLEREHDTILEALQCIGLSRDPSVYVPAQEAMLEVRAVAERLEILRNRALDALVAEEAKKKRLAAYEQSR